MVIHIYYDKEHNKIGYKHPVSGMFIPIPLNANDTFKLPARIRVTADESIGKINKVSSDDNKNYIYRFFPSASYIAQRNEVASAEFVQQLPQVAVKFSLIYINERGWFLEDLSNGNLFPFKFPQGQVIQNIGRGGGGGGGIGGIDVYKDGALVVNIARTLNFIGQLTTVADAGGSQANITIKIPSMTQVAREALVPTTALIVEDTTLDMYFKWSTVSGSWNPF